MGVITNLLAGPVAGFVMLYGIPSGLLAAVSPRALGEVFNVGTGVETNVNQLASMLARLTGSGLAPLHADRRDVDNIRRRVLNIEKTRRALRWVPEVTLEDGLRRTIAWQRARALPRVEGVATPRRSRRRAEPLRRAA